MKEDNNINTVPQTNQEPVQPVQPVQPVAQQPVQPVAQQPVVQQPQNDSEAIMEQKVVEMEKEMMKEHIVPPEEHHEEVVTPVAPEATPVATQITEPQIDPSFGTNVPNPVQPVPEPTKKKSKLPIVLVVLVILAIGGFACWKFLLPMLNEKTTNQTTTTTESTTTTTSNVLDIKSIDDYIKIVKDAGYSPDKSYPLLLDDTFYDIQYNLNDRCHADGDEVSYTIKDSKVSYKCVMDEISFDPSWGGNEWTADITVNDKYKIHKETMTTCLSWRNYTNGKYYMNFTHGCEVGTTDFDIEDENNNKIRSGKYEATYITKGETDYNYEDTPVIVKDNKVYFITADEAEEETETTCRVIYIDLNKETPEFVDMNVTGKCIYITEI